MRNETHLAMIFSSLILDSNQIHDAATNSGRLQARLATIQGGFRPTRLYKFQRISFEEKFTRDQFPFCLHTFKVSFKKS